MNWDTLSWSGETWEGFFSSAHPFLTFPILSCNIPVPVPILTHASLYLIPFNNSSPHDLSLSYRQPHLAPRTPWPLWAAHTDPCRGHWCGETHTCKSLWMPPRICLHISPAPGYVLTPTCSHPYHLSWLSHPSPRSLLSKTQQKCSFYCFWL